MYAAFPGNAQRQSLDVNEFDAAMMCILGAIAAKSNNGKAIASKLRAVSGPPGVKYTFLQLPAAIKALRAGQDINYEGIAGSIDWDAKGDPASATYDFYKYINGTLTVQRQYRTCSADPVARPDAAGKADDRRKAHANVASRRLLAAIARSGQRVATGSLRVRVRQAEAARLRQDGSREPQVRQARPSRGRDRRAGQPLEDVVREVHGGEEEE